MKKAICGFLKQTALEAVGAFLVALATYNVALYAKFPMTGFSGITLILYRLFRIPMGVSSLLLNLPLIFLCWKLIGRNFLLKSFRCMILCSVMLDHVAPLLPVYQGDRMIAALLTGTLCAIGYAIVYLEGSSTGGLDFISMAIKALRPHVHLGTITFSLDLGIILAGAFLFQDLDGIVYGLIVSFLCSALIDRIILGMNIGQMALIVAPSGMGKMICDMIDDSTKRGSTIFPAKGGYQEDEKDVVMVAGSAKDIYRVQRILKEKVPEAFIIVMESKEVQGEGFRITRVAGG